MRLMEMEAIRLQAAQAAMELLEAACPPPGSLLVVGCSTSEVRGKKIGTSGSAVVARAILSGVLSSCSKGDIALAVQCCEHLNRALVIERRVAEARQLEEVAVWPISFAGGALAASAMEQFCDPVVVESVKGEIGLDIGSTLIGMHLKAVAVPVRLKANQVGEATVIAAKTRPRYIGGPRAVYEKN